MRVEEHHTEVVVEDGLEEGVVAILVAVVAVQVT
jgi:hypothetical protein